MIGRLGSAAPMLLLILLAAASFWLERAVRSDARNDGNLRHEPDFWAENFTLRRHGPDGALQNTLTARRMTHYPDDDTTVLDGPAVRYHRQPPVTVSGRTGLVSRDGTEIALVGGARVVRGGKDGGAPVEIATQTLKLYPDDERAVSNTAVTITQGRSVIQGSGLEIDNGTGISVLHGRVTGTIYKDQ